MKRVGGLSLSKAPWSDGALGGAMGGLPECVEDTVERLSVGTVA